MAGPGMIRPYARADQDQLLDVWERAARIAHSFLPAQHFEDERREITDTWLDIAETTVFESEGQVVGFLCLLGDEVGGIFVDPDHQRTGIGRALMDDARAKRDSLELGVLEANAPARRFYEKYGFEVVERRVEPVTGEPELRLRLD
jgi:putative acetyltransferase